MTPTSPEASVDPAATAVQAVHDALRDRILSGELPPGAVVSQAKLARELGVSRSPVREACRMLESEGLVAGRANYRFQVAEFSVQDLEEIYASRLVLETLALSWRLPQLTVAELDQMDAALVDMRAAATVRDYARFTTPHDRFHSFLITDVGPRLGLYIGRLNDHAQRYRRVYTTQTPMAWDVVVGQDGRMLDAIRAGDFVAASDELALHLGATALATISLLDPLHDSRLLRAALAQARGGAGRDQFR